MSATRDGDDSSAADLPAEERDALLSIAHGAVVTSAGVSVQRGLSVATDVVLARGLGPGAYGVYAFAWRLVRMGLGVVNAGPNTTLLRDLPALADDPDRRRRALGLAYATVAGATLAVAVALVVAADWIDAVTLAHPSFPPVLRLFGVLLVGLALVHTQASALKGTLSANGEVLLRRVLQPLVRLLAVVVAVAAGHAVLGVASALAVSALGLAVLAYPATARVTGIRPTFRGLRSEAHHFYDHAVPSALFGVGSLLRLRLDVLLIGAVLTATAAGVYNVVLVLGAICKIPLLAFNQLMPPVAARLHAEGEFAVLDDVYTTVSRLIVTVSVPVVVLQVAYGRELLGLFGPTYTRGYAVLVVFLLGRFLGNSVGATGILLSMTNNHYPKMALEWLLVIGNGVLTYVLVTRHGLLGAAIGTSVAIVAQNALQLAMLRRFEGLWPYDATFLKPLVAGVGMLGAVHVVRVTLPGPLALVGGVFAGLGAYLGALLVLGVSPRDRLVAAELLARYRTAVDDRVAALR